jgi:hypothetical protein
MAALKTYDFARVLVLLGGVPITGFADGESITVRPNGDRYSSTKGNDGDVVHSRVNDDTYTVVLRLQAQSPGNAILLAQHVLDAAGNSGVVPFILRDQGGLDVFTAPECRIARLPDMAFGREAGTREWTLTTGKAILAPGGYV